MHSMHACGHGYENKGKCCKQVMSKNRYEASASGDSVMVDKACCEKMMGKDACKRMHDERGACLMSKNECAKLCRENVKACAAKTEE